VSILVVDASVVVKWFVPEIHSDAARRLLVLPHEYLAPDLLFAETANTIWKKIRREELTAEAGQQLVADVGQIAVRTVSCRAWPRTHIQLVQTFERGVQEGDGQEVSE
jgi:predicted nucleic acid-binding protein